MKARVALVALVLVASIAHGGDSGYVDEWLVCGPFPHDWDEGRLAHDPLQGESAAMPDADRFAGGEKWRRVKSGDVLDFLSADCGFATKEHAIAYAHVYVKAESERSLVLSVGSDDGVAIWVNGARVAFNDTARGHHHDQDRTDVKLEAGWNRVLFKVSQGVGDWALSARFLEGKKPADGLVFSATNPDPRGAFAAPTGDARLAVTDVRLGKEGVEVHVLDVGGPAGKRSIDLLDKDGKRFGASEHGNLEPGQAEWVKATVGFEAVSRLLEPWSLGTGARVGGLPRSMVNKIAARLASLPGAEETIQDLEDARTFFPEKVPADALPLDSKEAFEKAAKDLARKLAPLADEIKKTKVFLMGNAHIDMAWLWRWSETVRVCNQTYAQALAFMNEFDEFKYTQSSAQTFKWMEDRYPELFAEIQKRVKEGRFEIVGGTWVECDNNMPSGEAYCRQLLQGKRYFKEKFDVDVTVGWMPDSFGFAWTLPQIYRKAGITTFLTTKLDWSDGTRWNERLFHWEGPDGSRLLVAVPRDGYEKFRLDPNQIARVAREEHERAGLTAIPYMYGVGDHGGGPTREAINQALALEKKKFYPALELATAKKFFEAARDSEPPSGYPVVRDELYLEYHRGVLTSQEPQKKQNRRAQNLLLTAEKLGAIAELVHGREPANLTGAWRLTLFNQFHDLLPGSGIRAVYEDSKKDYEKVFETCETEILRAWAKLAPEGVRNDLPWARSGVIGLSGHSSMLGRSFTFVKDVPATGSAPLVEASFVPVTVWKREGAIRLENSKLRVTIDTKTGAIISLIDLASGREALAGPANVLEALDDRPPYYDAWEVTDKIVHGKPLDEWGSVGVAVVTEDPRLAVVAVNRSFRSSSISQMYALVAESPKLDIATLADWHDHHVLVKAAFPLVAKDRALAGAIPFGTIERPTTPETPAEKGKFEFCAHEWVDLSEHDPVPDPESKKVDLPLDKEGAFDAQGVSYPEGDIPFEVRVEGVPVALSKKFLSCRGQKVALPDGDWNEALFAGASTEGDEAGVLTLTAASGSTYERRLWLTDWCFSPVRRDAVVAEFGRRITPTGDEKKTCRIWATSVPIESGTRTVTLPDRPRMKVFALVLVKRPSKDAPRHAKFGCSILSDTKYGWDVQGSRVPDISHFRAERSLISG